MELNFELAGHRAITIYREEQCMGRNMGLGAVSMRYGGWYY